MTDGVSEVTGERVDVLIVGSGPVGAAFARTVHDGDPSLRVLVLEAGPRLTAALGANVRNVPDPAERDRLQRLSEGPAAGAGDDDRRRWSPRPGTHRFLARDADTDDQDDLPDAAASTNVGGMGAHWTCACPVPSGAERIGFLPDDEWDDVLARARRLLAVTTAGFEPTPAVRATLAGLGRAFDAGRPEHLRVQAMPLACTPRPGASPLWSGADTVLGPLATGSHDTFALRDRTVVTRVLHDGDRATGVVAVGPDGEYQVAARAVVVAADALRTPQLLWASGIRPQALGRYLNDQPQVISAVFVPLEDASGATGSADGLLLGESRNDTRDRLAGVSWVPYVDDLHPYHGQVMQLDASPIDLGVEDGDGAVVGLGWFCAKQPRADDRVEFDPSRPDAFGLPSIRIHYRLTDDDLATIEGAKAVQRHAAAHLGGFVPRGEPRLLPAGSSLHYQGTTRMGEADDGTCVCDSTSLVWGLRNLWVGGNGVIPTPTACNPTLTSVALAIRAARALVASLR